MSSEPTSCPRVLSQELLALPGRSEILDLLDHVGGGAEHVALVLCDVDGFRRINDGFGRRAGDAALVVIGARLRATAHAGDVVGWLGGDEFLVLCTHGVKEAEGMAGELCAAMRAPVPVDDREHELTLSVGIATLDGQASTLRNLATASAALRLAKERGRDRVEAFDAGLKHVALRTLTRTSELRNAAALGQLRLHFQPVVDLVTGEMLGCEGLLRWEHPVEGVLPPAAFLDVAASSGLLDELTADLVDQAAAAAAQLAARRSRKPSIAFNLAAQQLMAPGLLPTVKRALETHSLGRGQLVVEITETSVLSDLDRALTTLHGLQQLGVELALDDFGTGYSSLHHLRRLPVSIVKIDRSFVAGILRDPDDLTIVASVIDLALRLGLRTVAEGVETGEQAVALRDLGCDAGQGFLWSPAVPLDQLPQERRTPGHAHRVTDGIDQSTRGRILRLHADGASVHTIAAALNAAGLRNGRGRRWHPRSVLRVLASARQPDQDRVGWNVRR